MRRIITGILIIMFSAVTAQAVYAKAVGKFVKVEGRVDITRPGKPAELVNVGTEIFEKDIIRSKSNSKAEILFRDGNVLRLAQKTRVEVSEYISDTSRRSTILNLFRGKIQNKVKKLFGSLFGNDKNRYEVHTPTSVCGVRGTDFFMYYQKGVSGATFKEGFGYAYNRSEPDRVVEVLAGQSMVIANTDAPPVIRSVTQEEINRHEEETTPAEEETENIDEEDNSEGTDNSGGEAESVDEEGAAGDEGGVAEEGDTEEGDSEVAGDEGSATGEETEVADSEAEGSSGTGEASATDDSEFISVDTGSSEVGVDDGGVSGILVDSTDSLVDGDLSGITSQVESTNLTTESLSTNTVTNDATQVDLVEQAIESTTATEPEPEPIMNVSGKLLGIVSGTHVEAEYILPRSTDPNRQGYTGKIEAAMYQYDYFQADDGTILRGSVEEEISDPDTWTMYNYLPDNILITETGGEDVSTPEITESTWTQTDLDSIATPPAGYYLRYQSETTVSMVTGIGSFTGEILGISSELWSATGSAPAEISLSGQYTSTGEPLYLFKSPVSGSFTDGGTYSGFISGEADNAAGFIHALYINPEGTELGILSSEFSGLVDAADSWSATGTMYPTVFSTDPGTITNDNFISNIGNGYLEVERLSGSFSGSSVENIKAHGFGDISYITGYDWGIFNLAFGYAKYDESAVSSAWSGAVSGFGDFGNNDGGMWIVDIANGEWDTSGITGDLSGKYLTMTQTGTIEGSLVGPEGSAGDWAAVSQGTWQKTDDLLFSSSIDGNVYFVRSEEDGRYYNATNGSEYSYHYDLYSHEGSYSFYNSSNSTDTYGQINAWDFDGTVADLYYQKWVYNHDTYAFTSYTSESATGFLLQSLRDDPATYTGGLTWDYHDQWTSYNMSDSGWFEGILGGLDSPWNATSASTADITLLGLYEAPFYITADQPVIFAIDIESKNPDAGTATTFDGGAYSGFMGGVLASSTMGNIYAIYVDPDNNAGILLGNFQGSADRMSGTWEADGGVYPVQLYSSIGVTPANLVSEVNDDTEYHFWDNSYSSQGEDGGFIDGSGYISDYFEIGGGHFFSKNIDGQPWGVWQNVAGGAYTGTPGSDWIMNIHNEMSDESGNVSGIIAKYGVSGGTWSGSEIDAEVLGAWVDLEDVVVGVSSGKLAGTYDPTEMTWQTLGSGVWIKASRFIDMAATTEGRATLEQLNIPAVEIGRTTLNGTGSSISVTMNDVIFFASSTGATPEIWATDTISGTYSVTPYLGDYVYMANSDSSITADFTLKKWDNNNWAADISNGNGTLNRTDVAGTVDVSFDGVAGGAYTGTTSGSFSGEGAGVAR